MNMFKRSSLTCPLQRRRAQNRASQKAYRARKDQMIQDLERKLAESREHTKELAKAYAELHAQHMCLKSMQASKLGASFLWSADAATI
jgi:predicted RNase H-like nuclease (RuvC/YqgF family)